MIPKRKLPARKAKAVFFRDINDIDVFVEDTSHGTEKLYTIILKKAFESKYNINKVYSLGGKLEVADAWNTRNKNTDRKELYIIDADFSLYGIEQHRYPYNIKGKSFFVLSRFSIESYLVDENAVIRFLDDEDLNKSEVEIRALLKFNEWLNKNKFQMTKLFLHMATVRAIDESIGVKRWKYSDIINTNDGYVSASKISQICEELKKDVCQKVSKIHFRTTYSEIRNQFKTKTFELTRYVCAKDFLLMLLILRMKKVTPFKENNTLIKQKIAARLDGYDLKNEFKNAI